MEAIVNNNNSLVAPIRGFDFGELLGTMELSTSTTLNLQLHSARTGKFVAVSLPISILLGSNSFFLEREREQRGLSMIPRWEKSLSAGYGKA